MQQQRLAQEIQDADIAGFILDNSKRKTSRSLPPLDLKPIPKNRVRAQI